MKEEGITHDISGHRKKSQILCLHSILNFKKLLYIKMKWKKKYLIILIRIEIATDLSH